MVYGLNSYTARITDQEEIKELEDLFNGAKLYKTDKPRYRNGVLIIFYGEKGTTHFHIDEMDFIKLEDVKYAKSEQITFKKLYSIWEEKVLRR